MPVPPSLRYRLALAALALVATTSRPVYAAEHVTLRSGAEFDCIRRELAGDRIRLYLFPSATAPASQSLTQELNYVEVAASAIVRVDIVPDPPPPAASPAPQATQLTGPLTPAETRRMLDRAGALHNIDADLLASIVKAESNGNALAVSRCGAQGLMQLMPTTASELGVSDSFAPDQNIGGGTAYLDQLLIRYDPHNDIRGLELAIAAYNAGPAAVDRYHGIPPYAETRAYVARVINEFNRRKRATAATTTLTAHAN